MRAFGVMDDANKTPAQGAATSVLPTASPLLEGVTGRYCEDSQEARTVACDDRPEGGVAAHALAPLVGGAPLGLRHRGPEHRLTGSRSSESARQVTYRSFTGYAPEK